MSDGDYTLTLTKQIHSSAVSVYDAFTEPTELDKWFSSNSKADLVVGGEFDNDDKDIGVFLVLDKPGHLRFIWNNAEHCPGTEVDFRFVEVGAGVTSVTLEHSKLPSAAAHEDMKEGWSWALDCVKSLLETGVKIGFEDWKAR